MNAVSSLLAFCLVVVLCESCCVPDQWEAIEGIVTGIDERGRGNLETGSIAFAYDALSERIAAGYRVYYDDKERSGKVIMDFGREKQYIISRGVCVIAELKKPFQKSCIPGDAKPYTYTLGVGDDILTVKSYQVKYEEIMASISVTNDCVPVSEILTGQIKGVSFVETIGYTNVTVGIANEGVFTPPPICMGGRARHMIYGKLRDPIMDLRKHAILGM
ncbi:uncharacterized protein LOC110460760 [Mizuhopecten yessoensis]|uniref:Mammalian ependymin-related protein 1 n=1 Tax=Mizuhopecten yessoensis TaxID=6573 RepID=A0A210Q1L5_MIZYE|nr:uncharacterized protein LOC110460760 [Mizuhopecten yessoensis]OWF42644.1 hypothetical protein KP79_PYT04862 [Mizuhopecten yessoensis]